MELIKPQRFEDIRWHHWSAVDLATLMFVIEGDQVLLIHKKRGLGEGKINGPGGKLEPRETPVECAIRECEEEVGITPIDPSLCGINRFQFVDGYSIHVWVYRAESHSGIMGETDEAIPFWCSVDNLPYNRMWADDRYWLPWVLDRTPFDARWLFDGDQMLGQAIDLHCPIDDCLSKV